MIKPVGRFVSRSFLYAAGFFAVWYVLSPLITPTHDTRTGLWTAVVWAPFMVLFKDTTTRRQAAGKAPMSPMVVIGIGLVTLAMYTYFGWFTHPRPVGIDMWLLLGLAALSLGLIICGIVMLRPGSKKSP